MESLEAKTYCAGAFLDISQVFDRELHEGLLYQICSTNLLTQCLKILSAIVTFKITKFRIDIN